MTDQPTLPPITTPQAQRVDKHVKRIPPDVLHWLHTVRNYSSNSEAITGLAVTDGEIEFVLMTRRSWELLSEVLNRPYQDRYRALYEDRTGAEKGSADGS